MPKTAIIPPTLPSSVGPISLTAATATRFADSILVLAFALYLSPMKCPVSRGGVLRLRTLAYSDTERDPGPEIATRPRFTDLDGWFLKYDPRIASYDWRDTMVSTDAGACVG